MEKRLGLSKARVCVQLSSNSMPRTMTLNEVTCRSRLVLVQECAVKDRKSVPVHRIEGGQSAVSGPPTAASVLCRNRSSRHKPQWGVKLLTLLRLFSSFTVTESQTTLKRWQKIGGTSHRAPEGRHSSFSPRAPPQLSWASDRPPPAKRFKAANR
jgi:hypothetical protein